MSKKLDAYLLLEGAMVLLDEVDQGLADVVRDAMDPVWYKLSESEHAELNNRSDSEVGTARLGLTAPFKKIRALRPTRRAYKNVSTIELNTPIWTSQ